VFGDDQDQTPRTSGEGLHQWDEIMREVEGRDPFGDIPDNLPGVLYARKVLRRAEPEAAGKADRDGRDKREEAVGEELLEAVRRARALGVDPELALRAAADRLRDSAR
jgi:XTP/dITP diphosphohydrolase/tetrapyrrole methylase family protein/MazG family protein/ATP diphosphatase